MQRWGYGCNQLYKTCHVYLEEAPWWVFSLMDLTPWLCDHMPRWRVPLIGRLKVVDEGETFTYAEWYGDTWHDLFHAFVDAPVTQWAFDRIKSTGVRVPWEQGKATFYKDDPARWDEMENDPEFGIYEGMTVEEAMGGA